jgi:hypothetical protein
MPHAFPRFTVHLPGEQAPRSRCCRAALLLEADVEEGLLISCLSRSCEEPILHIPTLPEYCRQAAWGKWIRVAGPLPRQRQSAVIGPLLWHEDPTNSRGFVAPAELAPVLTTRDLGAVTEPDLYVDGVDLRGESSGFASSNAAGASEQKQNTSIISPTRELVASREGVGRACDPGTASSFDGVNVDGNDDWVDESVELSPDAQLPHVGKRVDPIGNPFSNGSAAFPTDPDVPPDRAEALQQEMQIRSATRR